MTMSRRKPASRTAIVESLSEAQTDDLLDGYTIVPATGFGIRETAFRAAWQAHRAALLPAFIARFPGRRPFAEWVCHIAPQHGQRPVTCSLPAYVQKRFGIYHTSIWAIGPNGTRDYLQQPEEVFLARAGLLLPGELERARERLANDTDPGRFVWPPDLQ